MGKRIDNLTCHCQKMTCSARNVAAFYNEVLKESGITLRQYFLLFTVGAHPGCSVRELGEYTDLDRSTLSRSLKPLIDRAYLCDRREEGARDRKLFLTQEGEKVSSLAGDLWKEAQRKYEEKLGKDNVRELERILALMQDL